MALKNLPVELGGTGADTQSGARTNLGLGSSAVATLIDDDSMATATASNIGSAESIKAYFDNQSVASYTAAKALTAGLYSSIYIEDADRGGMFVWRAGDQSANITADTAEIFWIPPDSDATGASGAWQRLVNEDGFVNVRWAGAVGDSDATTGDGTDNTSAIQACIDWVKTTTDGTAGSVYIPASRGYYRTTAELNTDSATNPVHIMGDGREASVLYGDFTDPDKSIIRFSRDYQQQHHLTGVGFQCNDNKNSPIGATFDGSTNIYVHDVAARGGRNSTLVCIGVNNSYFSNIYARNGYQPLQSDMPSGTLPTVSITASDQTLTADSGTPFSDVSVGDEIFVLGAGANGRNKVLHTTVATVTNSTSIELTDAASTTVSGTGWSLGCIRGSYDKTTNTLTLSNDVLDSDDVGRLISMRAVYDYNVGGNNELGGRSARIKAVTSPNTCTLYRVDGSTDFDTGADVESTTTDQMVFFGPAIAFYFTEEDNTSNDDNNITDCRIEDHDGPGLYLEYPTSFRVSNTKIHGRGWTTTNADNVFGRTPCCVYTTNIRGGGLVFDQCVFEHSSSTYDGDGQIIVEATERPLVIDNSSTSSKVSNPKFVSMTGVAEAGLLMLGNIVDVDDIPANPIDRFYVTWLGANTAFRGGQERSFGRIVQFGGYTAEGNTETLQLYGGSARAAGFSSSRTLGNQIDDDEVVSIYPPTSRGVIEIHCSRQDVFGRFKFRTSDNQNSAQLFAIGPIGDDIRVHGTNGSATLTGTTGTDGFVNISVDGSSGQIHIENRIADNNDLTYHITH